MLRAELGLSYREVIYEISLANLKLLSQCTPNFNYKNNNSKIKDKKGSMSLESFFNTLPTPNK